MDETTRTGTYACPDHPGERVTMFIRPRQTSCGKCHKPLAFVKPLSAVDEAELKAEHKRADREEAALARAGL